MTQLQARMAAGELSARQLVEAYLARIEAIDRGGPTLRSVHRDQPRRARDCRGARSRARRGRVRGPLHGIPILLKDNIDTADRMQTTAGSLALLGAPSPPTRPSRAGCARPAR